MDWNVFFSTISQTSGAIVSIFTAFLITKIISNQSEFAKLKNEATHYLIDSESAVAETKARRFEWYNKILRNAALESIEDEFWQTKEIPTLDDCKKKYNFSPFDGHENIKNAIRDKISELSEKLEAERQENKNSRFNNLIHSASYNERLTRSSRDLISLDLKVELKKMLRNERDLIDQLIVKIERQAKRNSVLIEELKSGSDSVNLVSCSIIAVLILFFAGVIYPLSFLPWDSKQELTLSISAFWDILFSLQGVMLTLISLIFSTLMIVFFFINLGLKHRAKLIADITFYSDASNYSRFLFNYVNNKNN